MPAGRAVMHGNQKVATPAAWHPGAPAGEHRPLLPASPGPGRPAIELRGEPGLVHDVLPFWGLGHGLKRAAGARRAQQAEAFEVVTPVVVVDPVVVVGQLDRVLRPEPK